MKRITLALAVLLAITLPSFAQERASASSTADAALTRANPHAATATDATSALVTFGVSQALNTSSDSSESAELHGRYVATLRDRTGRVKWTVAINNVVTTVGKNLALDTFLAGSSYTVTGPYMGLISSVSYSATSAADTMASHAGWTEAGITNAPTYTTRKTAAWSSASAGSKALSASLTFTFTGSGTVKGCFLVFGSGAVATVDNTSGTLYSVGVFSGGDRIVSSGDSLAVSYTASL